MSKLSPLGQSMASLFSPERESIRKQQESSSTKGTQASQGAFRISGAKEISGIEENSPTKDSLGNPTSPGHGSWGKKKKAEEEVLEQKEELKKQGIFEPQKQPQSQFIKLNIGWEKILFIQKKICQKAKEIITKHNGPESYFNSKSSTIASFKSRGCVVDLDMEVQRQIMEAKKKESA
ncbi:MAG: hypothetical protein M9962_04600 [Oligoflexia bacterium]|nr:hypothetical protein [Oligoflexia bacterium]